MNTYFTSFKDSRHLLIMQVKFYPMWMKLFCSPLPFKTIYCSLPFCLSPPQAYIIVFSDLCGPHWTFLNLPHVSFIITILSSFKRDTEKCYKCKLKLTSFPETTTWLSWRLLILTQHISSTCVEKSWWKIKRMIFFSFSEYFRREN